MPTHRPLRAFTLFEIAISLALVAVAVTSMLMLFVSGIKTQQLARFKLFAAAKAEEMVESFASSANSNPNSEVEGTAPWEVPAGYRVSAPDLEVVIASHRYGIAPLPMAIARRLDSDGDEMQRVLDEGGYLYYAQPMATTGIEEARVHDRTSNETQKLVFAVVGYAQQNAVPFFPWKAWPYYEPYPSPPGHGFKNIGQYMPALDSASDFRMTAWNHTMSCWEGVGDGGPDTGVGTTDPDIRVVFDRREADATYGFRQYAYGANGDQGLAYNGVNNAADPAQVKISADSALRYLQAALWYCDRKSLGTAFYDPSPVPTPGSVGAFTASTTDRPDATPDQDKWKQVMAMRFLAHAATCLTRWHSLTELSGAGLDVPAVTIANVDSPHIALTHDKIVYYHERCLNLAMSYAAMFPYDWAAPRPTQRPIMSDYPLIEWDLWSPTDGAGAACDVGSFAAKPALSGPIDGAAGHTGAQWRPIAAQPIANIGRSYHYPDRAIPVDPTAAASVWGNQGNVTLTRPFRAADRCRQIVFWAVDWKAYVDAETAPGAPIDASKYLFAAPQNGRAFAQRMMWDQWTDHHVYAFRNPEKNMAFAKETAPLQPTGADMQAGGFLDGNAMYAVNDHGTSRDQLGCFLSAWGADRNFDRKLDRGPVPASVRMRAITVARYNYYDPVLTMVNR